MLINQRLKDFIDYKKVNATSLARIAGCSKQVVSSWFARNVKIQADYIINVIIAFDDLNARWLITGEGEMLDGRINPQIVEESRPIYGDCLARLEALGKECGRLETVNQFLKEELSQLKGNSGREPVGRRARTG